MSIQNSFNEFFISVWDNNKNYDLPVIEIVGDESDKTLFITSALHGDEYEAFQAIILLKEVLKKERISGRVIALPVANPAAFRANSRITPELLDGENLARSFPGDPNGTLTQKIASNIWNFILENRTRNSYLLDLHSGGQHYSYVHLSGIRDIKLDSPETKIAMDLARAMQMSNLWIMPDTKGTISTVAINEGIPAIGCEVEGTGGLNQEDVRTYLNGILNVLRYTKQLQAGELKMQEGEFFPIQTILSPSDGFISKFPNLNHHVKVGEEICEISDYFGNLVEKVISPCEGRIWAIRRNPSITKEEIVALVSDERNR